VFGDERSDLARSSDIGQACPHHPTLLVDAERIQRQHAATGPRLDPLDEVADRGGRLWPRNH
jgi:hypothetical protein